LTNKEKDKGRSYSALILSSGLSERMGQPKALLNWDESRTFIGKIMDEYRDAGCEKVVCTVNRFIYQQCLSLYAASNVTFILNEHPEWGRLYSVKLGLAEVRNSDFCFIQNVDNPFINSAIISGIAAYADPGAWCSPEFNGRGGHPVLIPQIILRKILEVTNQESTLQNVLRAFPKKVAEMEDDKVLRNINTPEEYRDFVRKSMRSND